MANRSISDKNRPSGPLDPVLQASLESFPASDPPSFNPGEAAPGKLLPRDLLYAQ